MFFKQGIMVFLIKDKKKPLIFILCNTLRPGHSQNNGSPSYRCASSTHTQMTLWKSVLARGSGCFSQKVTCLDFKETKIVNTQLSRSTWKLKLWPNNFSEAVLNNRNCDQTILRSPTSQQNLWPNNFKNLDLTTETVIEQFWIRG
jgi:hypothetical protein